jgi:hypothetical protein
MELISETTAMVATPKSRAYTITKASPESKEKKGASLIPNAARVFSTIYNWSKGAERH